MRKILFLGTALVLYSIAFAANNVVELPIVKADKVFIPIGKTGQKISYAQLATISLKDLQTLTGKKMNFFERVSFKLAQNKIRKGIAADGTIKDKKVLKLIKKADGEGFNLGGFALGFLVGLIGVLIAYLINDDQKSNRVKWAWIGFAAVVVLWLILVLSVL